MSTVEPVIPLSRLPGFDPRTAPVLAPVGSPLAPVEISRLQAAALRERFVTPPEWHPEMLAEPRFANRPLTPASVLIPIVQRPSPTVLLTQRTAHLANHSGQIAFPGGKQDPEDADLLATALREAHEEVGLDGRYVDILGTLPVYTTGTGFVITPVIGLVDPGFSITRNPDEVDAVFEVPLHFLMDPANHRRHAVDWNGQTREWLSMPYVDADAGAERFIWGATAGILRNFYRFLAA